MLNLFGNGKSDHPMADLKWVRKILDDITAGDPFKALEDLSHWLESVCTPGSFKPDHRAQLVQLIDESAQLHLRKLQREYLSSPRLSKSQENRLWAAIREWYRQSALAFAICIDAYATGQKGWEDLKQSMPLLTVRALRSLAAQMKWQHIRYGPPDDTLWVMFAKIYALAENRKYSQSRLIAYAGLPGETSPEQEFLKAVMFAASSPDSLLPVEIELVERLIANLSGSFKLTTTLQPDIVYCFDLANHEPPVRAAHLPHRAPTLRYFAAGGAGTWVAGVIRRFQRESSQGTVGIPTLGRVAVPVRVKLKSGKMGPSLDTETAILLNPADSSAPEAQLLLRSGALVAGQNLELERNGKIYLLLPAGATEHGDDYDLIRCRQMIRDARE